MTRSVRRTAVVSLCVIGIGLSISSCASFQSPRVLEEGERSWTLGGAAVFQRDPSGYLCGVCPWIDTFVEYRSHLANRLDFGLRANLNLNGSAVADLKYQVVKNRFFLAVSAGGGVAYGEAFAPSYVRPVLAASVVWGTETDHLGARASVGIVNGGVFLAPVAIVAGVALGEQRRVLLSTDIGLHLEPGAPLLPIVSLGVGFRQLRGPK